MRVFDNDRREGFGERHMRFLLMSRAKSSNRLAVKTASGPRRNRVGRDVSSEMRVFENGKGKRSGERPGRF
jgi:hypothetical protein